MWYNDTVYLQTKVEVNTYGSIKTTWTQSTGIVCDVQPMSKEKAYKEYGLADANNWKEVFAPLGSGFIEGYQVKYANKQYLVRLVQVWGEINHSNHVHVILSEVV